MAENVYEQQWAKLEEEPLTLPFTEFTNPDNPWLPKTDWCCDRIIANED